MTVSLINVVRKKMDIHLQKNETGCSLSHTVYKNQLKMKHLYVRPETVKLLEDNGENVPNIGWAMIS
jgi:hypothetical protein